MMKSVFYLIASPFIFLHDLYAHGFKTMSKMNKTLWIIGTIKVLIMFGLLKIFFFKSYLSQFDTEQQKIEHLSTELTTVKKP